MLTDPDPMKPEESSLDNIVRLLGEKAPMKMDVFENLQSVFHSLKGVCRSLEHELQDSLAKIDKRIQVKYSERGNSDIEFRFCDDILIISMHTDAYTFSPSHQIWKNSYVTEEPSRHFCGMISIYNFLTGSLKYNRINDQGILIARLFVNRENHFFVEGKKQLGIRFNNFETDIASNEEIRSIVETAILHCLDTDILTPPFENVRAISVQELIEKSLANVVSTGKRLGFRLQSDNDLIG